MKYILNIFLVALKPLLKFFPKISDKHQSELFHLVNNHNLMRLRYASALGFFLNLGLSIIHLNSDIYKTSTNQFDNFLLCQIVFMIISIITFISTYSFYSKFKEWKENPLIWLYFSTICLWGAFYTLLHFPFHYDLTAYIASLLISGILFVSSPLLASVVYLISLLLISLSITSMEYIHPIYKGQVYLLISITFVAWIVSRLHYFSFISNFNNYTRLLNEFDEKEKARLEVEDMNRRFEAIIEERSKEILNINKQLIFQVDENRKAMQALAKSEKYYREFVDFLPLIVWEFDTKGIIKYCNKEVLKQFQLNQADIESGVSVFNLVSEEDITTASQRFDEMLHSSESIQAERFLMKRKDNSNFPCLTYAHTLKNNDEIIGIRGVLLNISESEKVLKALELSEKKYKELTELLPLPVFEIDSNLNFIYANKESFRLFGYESEDLNQGINVTSVIDTSEYSKLHSSLAIINPNHLYSNNEYMLKKKNGSTFPGVVYLHYSFSENKITGAKGIIIDISDIRKTQKELEVSEEKYRNLAENIEDGIFSTSMGLFTSVNSAMINIFGYFEEELIGKPAWELAVKEEQDFIKETFFRKAKEKDFSPTECNCQRADGKNIIVEIRLSKVLPNAGTFGIVSDVTERRSDERKIKESEEKYRELVENINEGLALVDVNENIIFANKAAGKIFGLEPDKLVNRNLSEFTTKNELSKVQAQTQLRKQGISTRYELEINSNDGLKKYCQLTATPRFNASGNFIASLGLLLDMTQKKLDDQRIKESEEKYRRIFENIQDVYFEIGFDGIILEYSPSIEFVSKYNRTELIGTNILNILDSPEEFNKAVTELIEKGYILDYELKLIDKDRSVKHFTTNARLIEEKGLYKIVGSLHDLTNRKLIETKIRESLKEKEILLKEIHHRVKNNLQIIHSMLSLQSSVYQDEILQNIFKEAQNRIKTMSLVHENLYMSKNFAKINSKEYLLSLVNFVTKSYIKSNQKLKIISEIEEISLDLDTAIPLGLIITELISNSMKYAFGNTNSGELSLKLEQKNGQVSFFLKDDGPGLPVGFDIENSTSLGMKLIMGLSDQIGAKTVIANNNGFQAEIAFTLSV